MALVRPAPEARADQLAFALAALLPFLAYAMTASGFGYWHDGGELVAAGLDLDIAHPPGHPLASLIARIFGYVPLGPLAFRVALGQAACAAVACGFTQRAINTTLRALGVSARSITLPTSIGATWVAAFAPGFWLQAVRPEVYALEAALLAILIERMITLEARWPTLELAPFYQAALVFGLSLTNHHFIALMTAPAFIPTLSRVARARGWKPVAFAAALTFVGLLTYVYLPVRAGTAPPIDLGHPADASSFFWVVSARAYQHTNTIQAQPLFDRMLDVVLALDESLHIVTLLVALVGAWVLLRVQGTRRVGWIWTSVALASALARGWLGFVQGNPDALGYLMPAMLAIAALVASFVGAVTMLLSLASEEPKPEAKSVRNVRDAAPAARETPRLAVGIAGLLVLLAMAQLQHGARASNLFAFTATDSFDTSRFRDLPTRAVVVAYGPQTVFRYWNDRAVEASRPDVTVVPMPFLGYPNMIRRLTEDAPILTNALRGYLIDGELRQAEVQSLAAERPLLLEMDPRVPSSLIETIVPTGLLYNVEPGGAADTDVLRGARVREAILERLYEDLGAQREEHETRNQLVWLHYMDALFFAQVGARGPARTACERGLALAPANELVQLRQALGEPPSEGEERSVPLDVSAFQLVAPPP